MENSVHSDTHGISIGSHSSNRKSIFATAAAVLALSGGLAAYSRGNELPSIEATLRTAVNGVNQILIKGVEATGVNQISNIGRGR